MSKFTKTNTCEKCGNTLVMLDYVNGRMYCRHCQEEYIAAWKVKKEIHEMVQTQLDKRQRRNEMIATKSTPSSMFRAGLIVIAIISAICMVLLNNESTVILGGAIFFLFVIIPAFMWLLVG